MYEDFTEEKVIVEGKLSGLFKGFCNHDTCFKFIGGSTWRQAEYVHEYHHLDSPRAKIIRAAKEHKGIIDTFYIEVQGVKTRVKVKSSYD